MSSEQKTEENQQVNAGDPAIGFIGKLQAKYCELKQNAIAYPYVWASYGVVYGGFGLWFLYRWRKLRQTEDRVRALQERLRRLAEAESAASAGSKSAASSENTSTPTSASADVSKPPK